jgi:glycosyltransferase involved in cell wall biosynthesis
VRIVHQGTTSLPVRHNRGGALRRRMLELAVLQVAAGHDVRIFSTDSEDSVEEYQGVVIQNVGVRSRRPLRDYEMLIASRKFLRLNPPDIIHFHGEREGARFNSFLDVPTVLSVDYFRYRGSANFIGHRYFEGSLRRFDRILPVSQSCAHEFSTFWGSPAPVSVLYNGVNVNQFYPNSESGSRLKKEMGLKGVVVMYLGRLCEQKGTDVLLDTWEQSRPDGATLVMVGPIGQFGSESSSPYLARMDSLGVRYLGAIEESLLASVLNSCDVFVMPTVHDEMFGMAAVEAQACGKPVVASQLGGLVEAVGTDGALFATPGDPVSLSAALNSLVKDEKMRATMSNAARQNSLRFAWEVIASDAQAIYEDVRS